MLSFFSDNIQDTHCSCVPVLFHFHVLFFVCVSCHLVSSKVPFPPSEDRLLNANNNTLRSYVTVNRPTAPLAAGDRPSSGRTPWTVELLFVHYFFSDSLLLVLPSTFLLGRSDVDCYVFCPT